ncbi:hypothetical protein DEJ45_15865 [Streptomyces venezuelae]|uniref:hypothetical protein n=1 Tax=Streptomyces venezuelae TaxID=54571 RepID=UPI00123DEC11|nr:hypothetical protein [Streptomyces venezuelae]QES13745.1 hypothetical protein DEJ45_15865 [Streptomyces venezuelae]
MSVAQNTGIRKAVRQLLVAVAACTVVAGGAAFAVASDSGPVTPQTVAGVAEDNGWPVVPPKPSPTN